MHDDLSLKEIQKEYHGTYKSYFIGFFLCLILTGASFGLVITKALEGNHLIFAIVGLALVQAVLQLILFLHVGQEAKPRWETIILCFMVMVLLIIAGGSLWVMHDLDQRMMPGMMEKAHD